MQLWNIGDLKLIYSFTGWESAITALTPSHAVDKVVKFYSTTSNSVEDWDWGTVTSLSFRTDGQPTMTSGSSFAIVFWNLEESKVQQSQSRLPDSNIFL